MPKPQYSKVCSSYPQIYIFSLAIYKWIISGRAYKEYEPTWFRRTKDEYTGGVIHMYKGDYWECKTKKDWSRCPDLFAT
jgi:hypothetical protein